MTGLKSKHIANLGKDSFLRFLSYESGMLSVETAAQKRLRIAHIDVRSGLRTYARARTPLISRSTGCISHPRWVTATNRRALAVLFNTTVQWQNTPTGQVYQSTITGQRTVCTLCPSKTDLVYVGTHKNPQEGHGSLFCFRNGSQLWEYKPDEVVDYPRWWNSPNDIRPLGAYPYQMSCPDDGRYVVFSFMDYLYFVDARGHLLRKWRTTELLSDSKHHINLSKEKIDESIIIDEYGREGPIKITMTSAISGGPSYPNPLIGTIRASASGNVCMVGIKNVLVWLTQTGQLAHVQQLDIGSSTEPGDFGSIGRLELSSSGDVIVAAVTCCGWSILHRGRVTGCAKADIRKGDAWLFDPANQVIIVKRLGQPEVMVNDLEWRVIGSIYGSKDGADIALAPGGQFLFISGRECPVFMLSYG